MGRMSNNIKTKGTAMNGKLIATGVVCFALGFIAHGFLPLKDSTAKSTLAAEQPLSAAQTTGSKSPSTKATLATTESNQSAITSHNTTTRLEHPSRISGTTAKLPAADIKRDSATPINNSGKLKFTQRTEISDESIDELVPKPFNNSVKHLQPELKSKFANYLLAENQSDADRQAENFLNDALNRGQLAGIAEVSLISCKAGLCEVRLIEQAVNQTMPIVFKLMTPYRDYLQDAIASSTSDGELVYIHYLYNIKPSS